MLRIRKATADDVRFVYDAVCQLEETAFDFDAFRALYRANVQHPEYHYLIANYDDQPVGFVSLHTQLLLHHGGRTGEIQELFVLPDYRSEGIGAHLIDAVEKLTNEMQLLEMEVTPHVRRTDAHRFYQRMGFVPSHVKFTKSLE